MTDVVIIGAGTAGLTAAIYAARAGKSVVVLEAESIGGQISFSPRVENYPGIVSITGAAFSDALYEQAMALGVALELETVLEIKPGPPHTVVTDGGTYETGAVIVATGARHRHLGVAEEARFAGRGVSYCAVCDGAFYKGKDVAIVGGGSTALQSAELLAGLCRKVYLIHRRCEFRAESHLAGRIMQLPNVQPYLGRQVSSLCGGDTLEAVMLDDGARLAVDGLFVCVGQESANGFLEGVLSLDTGGFIPAGEDCRTEIDGIFAAGDCRSKAVRQLTTAAADGSVAALAACQMG